MLLVLRESLLVLLRNFASSKLLLKRVKPSADVVESTAASIELSVALVAQLDALSILVFFLSVLVDKLADLSLLLARLAIQLLCFTKAPIDIFIQFLNALFKFNKSMLILIQA